MNVTLLISFSVVMPSRTLSTADSRRNVMPSSFASRLISEVGRLFKNHFANSLAQIQQFVNRSSSAKSRAAAFEAARTFVERDNLATRPGSSPLSTRNAS